MAAIQAEDMEDTLVVDMEETLVEAAVQTVAEVEMVAVGAEVIAIMVAVAEDIMDAVVDGAALMLVRPWMWRLKQSLTTKANNNI